MSNNQRFQKVYRENYKLTRHVLSKFPIVDKDIEDLQHDVFLNFFKAINKIPEGQEVPFLIVAARNAGIDFIRKRKRRKTDLNSFTEVDPSEAMWESDPEREIQLQVVGKMIDELGDEAGADSFSLFYREGLTIKEIGERLDLPQGTVASRIARLRDKFSKRLQTRLESNS